MRLLLTAVDDSLVGAWRRFCGDLDFVSIHEGSILETPTDAVVSPANSFGFMDGGIDALYTKRFGRDLQDRLQDRIRSQHGGELLVGLAEVIETGDSHIPFLVSAPTMRVPMILRDSVSPYLAARAVLRLVSQGTFSQGPLAGQPIASRIQTVAFPGLGTGVGGVGPNTCARQMRAAIEEVLLGLTSFPATWADAQARHQLLYSDRVRDLQKE